MISRRYVYRPSRLGFVLVVGAVLAGAGHARAQGQNPIFAISDVSVDATAESASVARDVALARGVKVAVGRLFKRLVVRPDTTLLPDLDNEAIATLVQNMEILDEKTSSTRYLATLTVRFKPDSVRGILRAAGLRFSETISRPRLVLPVFEAAGAINLWDRPNAWREAWHAHAGSLDTVVPIVLPEGDLTDLGTVGPIQALAGEAQPLRQIAERYRTRDVLVAHATLVQDLAANRPVLHVSMRHVGPSSNAVTIETFTGVSRDQVHSLLAEAVTRSVERLADDWKRANYLRFNEPVRLSASVALGTLSDWLEISRRLGGAAVVQRVDLASITRSDAQVVIHYLGAPEQLGLALAQRDLDLIEDHEYWILQLSRRSASRDGR